MALTLATELANYAAGIGTQGATLKIDSANKRVGVGTTNPQGPEGSLQVGTGITFFGNTGIISAIGGKFSGDFTVGGTLTYEDVQNVNSSGVGTFSGGINIVGGGLTVTGVSTFFSRVSIADSIVHTGDINTSLRFPAADTFSVETGGAERLRVDSSGRLLVGSDTTITDDNFGIGNLQVTDKTGFQHVLFSGHSASASNATALSLGRSRGTQASPGYLSSGDHIARFSAISYNGGNYGSSGCIDFYAGDQHASNDLPGYIALKTVPDGSATLTERLRVTSAGLVGIGTENPTGNLEINAASTTDMIRLHVAGINFAKLGHNSASGTDILDVRSEGHTRFLTNGNNERVRINSAGRVGIATVLPEAQLTVKGDGDIGAKDFKYLYSNTHGIQVKGNEAAIDIVGTDSGNHGSSLLLRSSLDGFGLVFDPTKDQLRVMYTVPSADDFSIHDGNNTSTNTEALIIGKTGITTATQLFEGTTRVATTGKAIAMAMLFG